MRYVIIYDIKNDATRRNVYQTLKGYGAWKQYSAFEVELTKTQRTELVHQLKEIISGEDKIKVYRICGNCEKHMETLGNQEEKSSSTVI